MVILINTKAKIKWNKHYVYFKFLWNLWNLNKTLGLYVPVVYHHIVLSCVIISITTHILIINIHIGKMFLVHELCWWIIKNTEEGLTWIAC